jgi:citrate synthase
MISLRSAGSLLGELFALQPMVDLEVEEVRGQALRICAISPTIAAALSRLAEGKPLVSPDPRLGVAANYLYMLHGNAPDPLHAQLLEQYMVLAADHEMGAGTLAARVVASTGADLGSAMLAGLCALSGPLHGGAPHRALRMLDEIGVPDRTDAWLAENMERGGRVPGFGHRVYRTPDPRAVALRELSRQLGGDRLTLAERVEERVTAFLEREKPGRDLQVNVEFYAAVLMAELGIPANLFSTTFALARLPGWGAHILEQLEHNRLIRPLTEFKGGPLVSVPEVG